MDSIILFRDELNRKRGSKALEYFEMLMNRIYKFKTTNLSMNWIHYTKKLKSVAKKWELQEIPRLQLNY